jgi:DNA-binding IclR family transcriptional regulator
MPESARVRSRKRVKTSKQPSEKSDPYFSRAVSKALEALDRLSEASEPLTLAQLTAELSLTKASAFRLLHTLESLNYISKMPSGQYFIAGLRHPHLHRLVNQMMRVGGDVLERLSMEFRETVSLAALFENHIEVVAIVESPQLIRMGNTVGRILPPHASSLGKVITAFQGPEMREKLLRSYGTPILTPRTISDQIALRQEFGLIQRQGHAEDREESALGGHCFAAPILRSDNIAAGAISLSMPQMRLTGPELETEIIKAVSRAAMEITSTLGKS